MNINRTRRMSSNPLSISVSVKALRPEMDDNWLIIPLAVNTIDELKQHILWIECIDEDIDVELYLSDGLLCDNASIDDVIRDGDHIEIRMKKLNNSSLAKCCICLDPLDSRGGDGGAEERTLWCSHRFHKHCIDEWLKRERQCPICRRKHIPQMARRGGGHSRRPQYRAARMNASYYPD